MRDKLADTLATLGAVVFLIGAGVLGVFISGLSILVTLWFTIWILTHVGCIA